MEITTGTPHPGLPRTTQTKYHVLFFENPKVHWQKKNQKTAVSAYLSTRALHVSKSVNERCALSSSQIPRASVTYMARASSKALYGFSGGVSLDEPLLPASSLTRNTRNTCQRGARVIGRDRHRHRNRHRTCTRKSERASERRRRRRRCTRVGRRRRRRRRVVVVSCCGLHGFHGCCRGGEASCMGVWH